MKRRFLPLIFVSACSCQEIPTAADAGFQERRRPPRTDAGFVMVDAGPLREQIQVLVLLDGEPVADAVVMQGGTEHLTRSDDQGLARLELDRGVVGDKSIIASHPEARIEFVHWAKATTDPVVVRLSRFEQTDNETYAFQDPGEPERRGSTEQCGHCHNTINEDWHASPHRTSASNPHVHDSYAGTAHHLNAEQCAAQGGVWQEARVPGGGRGLRCFLGPGHLTEQPNCVASDCLEVPTQTGRCADCHAPAIDGQLGGRDLLESTGFAYDYGVSCDVCHRVEAVRPEQPAGVGGRLRIMRPSEAGDLALGAGGYLPLTFGPSHDSPNVRMGSVQRDHYRDGTICSGCHQYDQQAEVGLPTPNPTRWPDGRLPIHSTWAEWKAGVFGDDVACNACHMPPDADVLNGADHQVFADAETGIVAGWIRPAGSVRRHAWFGPRQPESGLLEHAATLHIRLTRDGAIWVAQVDTINSGCGHALPTGEPQRQVLLKVDLLCDGTEQPAVGGDVLPGYAGFIAQRSAGEDWSQWPAARPGDRIRVVHQTGGFRAYEGFGAFAGDVWNAEAKGIPTETAVGSVRIVAVDEMGRVQTEGVLPPGDKAYLIRGDQALAGAAGVGFARLLRNEQGQLGVHHSQATDVVSDNRLMPQARWQSEHRFTATCLAPRLRARLVHRDFFYGYAQSKAWALTDRVITEVTR